ncbi:phosphatase 2C-like domain-containing protein [Mycena vulgaris]|nr:phosphatase 2C-like domain-containing protein [Mycena vulgaris]
MYGDAGAEDEHMQGISTADAITVGGGKKYDVQVRVSSNGPRTLISMFAGDLVPFPVTNFYANQLSVNMRALFAQYQTDPFVTSPVDIQTRRPLLEWIHNTFRDTIVGIDVQWMKTNIEEGFSSAPFRSPGVELLFPMHYSACLITAFYEADIRRLHIVSVGNMRGILGRRTTGSGTPAMYDVHVLSADHTPNNSVEKARIEGLHPGENDIQDGKLLDRPYTRALGNLPLKWSTDIPLRIHKEYFGPPPDPRIKTPPYITSEPEINSIHILPGDFLVLSSPSLSDSLTDEEVVGLIAVWRGKDQGPPAVLTPEVLPVRLKEDKTIMYKRWNAPKQFVIEDDPTVTLVRNAMGGAETELVQATYFLLEQPESQGNAKPLGIMVVFFE